MVFLGTLTVDGGIDMYLEYKDGTYLVLYKSRAYGSYMYFNLDGMILASTFKNKLYEEILYHELMLRMDYVKSKICCL